jgi:hypothetical protein
VKRTTHRRFLVIAASALLAALPSLAVAGPAQAEFGLNNFHFEFKNADGSMDKQAGSHPYALVTSFAFNTRPDIAFGTVPDGEAKEIRFSLPAGLAGDPTATPRCAPVAFSTVDRENHNLCSDSAAIGIATLATSNDPVNPISERSPVYNIVPSLGSVAKIGFIIHRAPVTVELGVNGEAPNNIRAAIINIPQVIPVYGSSVELWGNPAAHVHDEFRGKCLSAEAGPNGELISLGICEAGIRERPFITVPRSCSGPLTATYEAVSWQNPLAPPTIGATETPGMIGCSSLDFQPQFGARPTTGKAESPSGIDVDINVDDPRLTEPTGTADSDIEKAVVTLPVGVTTNPSIANGLQACTKSQYLSENVASLPGTGCPEASKIGSVEVETPLLTKEGSDGTEAEVLKGSLYVAKQHDNPFDNLLSIYMVIKDPELGILVKQAGRVEPNHSNGQLTTTFEGLPPLPFSHFHLHFREGPRAPLTTPATCGMYPIVSVLYPYDHDLQPVEETATFEINGGAGGGACASSAGALPSSPAFSAGTLDSRAGIYSPFVLHLSRADGSQQFSRISTTLPNGLLGKLAGIPYCPEAGIAQAAARTSEGQGATELADPSCPASSQVGTVTVASGSGPEPLYVEGKAYLAGPYKGAPLSLEIITPAIAGPFDLGVVAVRTALELDPITAQITAVSDPIPSILHGLPLDVRSIGIEVNRPQFMLNPTSCEPKQITGSLLSTLGSTASLSQYFQASDCKALKFGPKLSLTLKGKTRRSGHPALKAVLTYPKGSYANIASAQVGLPHSEFLDQGNIGTVCTQPQLKSRTCPKKSIYGKATAWSPLLEKPVSGPVYLGVGYGHELPDLVADLDGQIRVLLNGRVDTDPQEGIRNTFEAVPDAPVSRFVLELKGGPRQGLLENSENICRKPQKATAKFTAQNGLVQSSNLTIKNDCGKKSNKRPDRRSQPVGTSHR